MFLYFFVRGLLPLLVWGLAVTGAYAIIEQAAGETAAMVSMVVVFPLGLFGLWKTCQAVM